LKLPYPGYSWSFNQHMGKVNSRELFLLVDAAYRFSKYPNYRDLINETLVKKGAFTKNFRSDSKKGEAWRDYQQVPAELGLMYSNKGNIKQPYLTQIGLMYIDGMIGFSELISTQVLAYQYPNGHKTAISPLLKENLSQADINIPSTRMELDIDSGVLIKPGVLILQILVELYRQGYPPTLNANECFMTLVPTLRNSDWYDSYTRLMLLRQISNTPQKDKTPRSVQEWFRFLERSEFAVKEGNRISLSPTVFNQIERLQEILDFHSDPVNFWMPQNSSKEKDAKDENAISWYEFFGSPSIEAQWVTPDELIDSEYLSDNYPDSKESDEIDNSNIVPEITEINLRPFIPSIPEISDIDESVNVENVIQGRMTRLEKTRQHQEIVARLAVRLTSLSYNVADDPNSVDLLAQKNGTETIFEVKTISRKNFKPRIRLGVGQLSEYRYRRQIQTQLRPHSILVLSNSLKLQSWEPDYFASDVNIGILCTKANSFEALTNGLVELEIQNSM
jgi:hypothetical protein